MLKQYILNGLTFQFEEGEQPAGAVEAPAKKPKDEKQAEAANKAAKAQTK